LHHACYMGFVSNLDLLQLLLVEGAGIIMGLSKTPPSDHAPSFRKESSCQVNSGLLELCYSRIFHVFYNTYQTMLLITLVRILGL
jgi:hypothetical protein